MLFSFYRSWYLFIAHLIPSGTPFALLSFIVVVETLSNFIRPVALTFRLTANILAGHLILSIVGRGLLIAGGVPLLLGALAQSALVAVELGVSFIQAYVFITLIMLYISEASEPHS